MRPITLRYSGECQKCGAALLVGASAVYERRVGIFCPPCAPTDPEEIRAYRQQGADRKAERYEGWAAKRKTEATATLDHIQEHYRGDWAFNSQPGHIPLRARIIRQEDKAIESLTVAEGMAAKAARLRAGVAVKGDAEARRQAEREAIRPLLARGVPVETGLYGPGTVQRVHRKTATVLVIRGSTVRVDLSWLTLISG